MMKSKTMFVVLMSGAGALCAVAPTVPAADESPSSTEAAQASEARSSLQISSEVAPDFLVPAPVVSPSMTSHAQWKNNPLLQSRPRTGVWLDGSDVQVLDAPPNLQGAKQGFEIEVLPAPPRALGNQSLPTRPIRKDSAVELSVQMRQAAKIAVERAQILESAGVPVMAGAQLRRAVTLAPHDIAARRALAQWTAHNKQWPEAAAHWREVLYQLKMHRDAPSESAERESWRAEATREMRTAQDHLLAFWQVPNVVTLGADSANPSSQSTPSARSSTAITVAMASTALTPEATPKSAKARVIAPEIAAARAVAPVIAPLVTPVPELHTAAVPSTLKNVVSALPTRQTRRELRFEIVVTSASYLHPRIAQNMALQTDDKANIATMMAVAKASETEGFAPLVTLDSSREQARQLSMQRQMQPWLGNIVRIGSAVK